MNTACQVAHQTDKTVYLSPLEYEIQKYEHVGYIVTSDRLDKVNNYVLQQLILPYTFMVLLFMTKYVPVDYILTTKLLRQLYTNKYLFSVRFLVLYLPIIAGSLSIVTLTVITYFCYSCLLCQVGGSALLCGTTVRLIQCADGDQNEVKPSSNNSGKQACSRSSRSPRVCLGKRFLNQEKDDSPP